MIDTHCHLNFKAFEGKVEEVIQQAKKAGVEKIIVPGTNLKTSQKAVNLAQKYDGVYAAVGIHPHHSNIKYKKLNIKNKLRKLVKNNKVVAIGECGLDYYQYKKTKYEDYKINKGFKKTQKEVFEMQIQLAKELNLPLIIHNRLASTNILKIIENFKLKIENLMGVLHCFQGDNQLLNWALKNDFFIGITGIITYDKKMQQVAKKVPLKNLLIETDAPFLTPEPLKSQKVFPNRPGNVKMVCKRIAKIKGDSFLKVAGITSNNAVRLFKI